jgi:homoserine O-acetyltransferase
MNALIRFFVVTLSIAPSLLRAAEYPAPTEGDYVIRDFKFTSGETMPELKIHYRTIGKPAKDAKGTVSNAVLITHGTTARNSRANFLARVSRSMPRSSSS